MPITEILFRVLHHGSHQFTRFLPRKCTNSLPAEAMVKCMGFLIKQASIPSGFWLHLTQDTYIY